MRALVWSSYGAPHPEAVQAMAIAAERTARHPRAGDPKSALRRWQAAVAVEIWRRSARMTQRCLRPLVDPERMLESHRGVEEGAEEAAYGEDYWERDETVER